MKRDVLAGLCVLLGGFGSALWPVHAAVVEHSAHPNGPWLPLTGATVTLSDVAMSTAQIPLPAESAHFYRISGGAETVLWKVEVGGEGLKLLFTPEAIPAPEIQSVVPQSVPAGGSFRIEGQHLYEYGVPPRVYFGGRELTVTGASQTQLTVQVPAGGWERCWNGSITTWMVLIRRDKSAGHNLTVSGIPASPPADISVQFNAAVQGRVMTVRAEGLSPDPALNLFQLGGFAVAGSSYVADWMDGYGKVGLSVPTIVQPGPTVLRVRRADGDGVSWSDPITFTVHAPTDLRVEGFVGSGTRFITPYSGYPAADSPYASATEWILTGSGFSTVCPLFAVNPGQFEVEIASGDRSLTMTAVALADDRARVSQFPMTEEGKQFLKEIQAGDALSLRPLAREAVDRSHIESAPIGITCERREVLGETASVWLPFEEGAEFTVYQGGLLGFGADAAVPCTLRAPGLWTGDVQVRGRWLCPLGQTGDYVVHDLTHGRSATIRVVQRYEYEGIGTREFGDEWSRFREDGILLGWGGLRLEIPAGALPESPIRSWYRVFVTQDCHQDSVFDSTVSDGRRRFSVRFSPEPIELLKPITLRLPYDPQELTGDVQLGKWNPDAQLYFPIPSEPGPEGSRVLVIPAGDYSAAAPGASVLSRQSEDGSGALRPQLWGYPGTTLGDLLDNLGVWSNNGKTRDFVDEVHKIRVDVVKDPASSDYVSDVVAHQVLETASFTHMFLTGRSWSAPEDWTVIYIRDLGNPDDIAGSTTKGVFGQPYVYINSRITGKKLETTVAHEMTHAFQRVMTVNIVAKWIDEAVANWAAYAFLGDGSDVAVDINAAPEFATRPIPATFTGGYGTEEQYAASAFIIWLANTKGAAVPARIYQAISGNPLNWERARTVLEEASGLTMNSMVTDFALAYWGQTYAPVDGLSLNIPRKQLTNWTAQTWAHLRPEYSSAALDFTVAPAFTPDLSGRPLVLRSTGERVSYRVFGCQGLPGLAPQAAEQIAHLTTSSRNVSLGAYDGRFAYYRIIAINALTQADESALTFVAPRVLSLGPDRGSKQGGYEVTISGSGFGAAVGEVSIGGFLPEIVSWTDTAITFRQINVGDSTGAWPVAVTTAEGAQIPSVTFTFTSP